jgi:type I restriction enzyme, S subunit
MTKWQNTSIGKIPSDWQVLKIENIADVTKLAGFEYTKHINYIEDGEIIALRALNIKKGGLELDLNDVKTIKKEVSEELPRSKLHKGDILLTNYGTIGNTAIIDEDDRYHLAPNVCRVRSIENICLPYFLYSYFRTADFQEMIINFTHGSTQLTIPMKNLRQMEIPIPPVHEQRVIVEIISGIDKKIDLLGLGNNTLEELAETLFRQWLVEEAKEEWEEKPIDEIANYLNGLACQNYPPLDDEKKLPVLKIRELRDGVSDNSDWASTEISEEYIVENGDVIFSWSGSLLVKIWDGENCILNQHLFKVTSKNYPKWFYYYWTKYHLRKFESIAQSKATTMGHIKRSDLSSSMTSVPSPTELASMDLIISPLLDKIIKNNEQVISLINIRDTMLPKLFRGKIRVRNEITG